MHGTSAIPGLAPLEGDNLNNLHAAFVGKQKSQPARDEGVSTRGGVHRLASSQYTGAAPLKANLPDEVWQRMPNKTCSINQAFTDLDSIHLQTAVPLPWLTVLRQAGTANDSLKIKLPKVIRWLCPPPGRLKLNVDGAFKPAGAAGGGGILRDQKGVMSFAFAQAYHSLNSNLESEAFALRDGIKICCIKGIQDVLVEIDSQSSTHSFWPAVLPMGFTMYLARCSDHSTTDHS
ncbi:hypothetical protein Taro_006111 [Colocasia esculenta]|uniref:RNase H type-1 domain-containing protein n=1 Tax=Colocasia esculenta TaxID=4460 RepID=A0A843TRS9_COLES|nr:hypothetical protein [Colocasia esculenta]